MWLQIVTAQVLAPGDEHWAWLHVAVSQPGCALLGRTCAAPAELPELHLILVDARQFLGRWPGARRKAHGSAYPHGSPGNSRAPCAVSYPTLSEALVAVLWEQPCYHYQSFIVHHVG